MKTEVLVVDNRRKLFNALNSLTQIEDNNFSFTTVEDWNSAVNILQNNEIEIILCNLDLEDKNEISSLQNIKKDFPNLFIVVCTDEANAYINEIYNLAHEILSDTIDASKLIKSLKLKEKMSKYLHDGKLMGIVNSVSDLPTLPATYLKIEKELASKSISIQKISSIISESITFTAKLLRVVNSPFFGLEYKVSNTVQAVNLLGVNVLKSILLYDHIISSISINPQHKKYFEDLWIHSNKVGRFAEQIIHRTLGSEIEMMEEAYIAGLMHDIGKVVLLSIEEYPENIFNYKKEHKIRFSSAEYKIYGTSHAEIGAYFLTLWGFPEASSKTVFTHNNPSKINFEKFNVQSATYIANAIAYDKEMDLDKLKGLNLGIYPNDWLNYLEANNFLK